MIEITNRGGLRRVLRLLAGFVLTAVVLTPAAATADPPTEQSSSGVNVFCEGEALLFLDVFAEDEGTFGHLDLWAPGTDPEFEEPTFSGHSEDAIFDGTTLTATFEGFDGGSAAVTAEFTPLGEPESVEDRFRDGNRWIEFSEMFVEAEVSGTVVFSEFGDFDLAGCGGSIFEHTERSTNPNAFIGTFEGQFLECEFEQDGFFGFLFAVVDQQEPGAFMDATIFPPEGPPVFGFADDATFTSTELSGTMELFSFEAEGEEPGEPVGTAVVEASLTSLGTTTNEIVAQNLLVKQTIERFAVDGTMTVTNGESMTFDLSGCIADSFTDRVRETNPEGPKPGGRAPSNDVADDADTLTPGRTTNAQTKGASSAPEEACVISFEFPDEEKGGDDGYEPEPLPFGRTLWYSFEGDGGPITVDTGGSNFDTALGVYVEGPEGLEQVECVDDVFDDVFSLQAAVTIDTDPGRTYLVQVGGFGFFGMGDEEEDSGAEYGLLRVRVH